jgi:hypothetical protein
MDQLSYGLPIRELLSAAPANPIVNSNSGKLCTMSDLDPLTTSRHAPLSASCARD